MKKLGRLALNEIQEFAPLSLQDQKSMKGGNANVWRSTAWEFEKSFFDEFICGSGSTSQGAATLRGDRNGIMFTVSGSRSVEQNGVIQIYYADSDVETFGSRNLIL